MKPKQRFGGDTRVVVVVVVLFSQPKHNLCITDGDAWDSKESRVCRPEVKSV